ncbi:MAG: hypothetical protein WCP58_03250 [bacterium]
MNGMMMEGTIPSAALAATLGQRAEQMKNDLAAKRRPRSLNARYGTELSATNFDPYAYFLLIAHPQQA